MRRSRAIDAATPASRAHAATVTSTRQAAPARGGRVDAQRRRAHARRRRCRSRYASTPSRVTEPGPMRLHAGIGHATGLADAQAEGQRQLPDRRRLAGPRHRRSTVAAKSRPTRCCRTCGSRATRCPRSRTRACWCAAGPASRRSCPTTIRWPARCRASPDAYVLACVRGGYTIGPCIGPLVADLILGREPALPLFDPARRSRRRPRRAPLRSVQRLHPAQHVPERRVVSRARPFEQRRLGAEQRAACLAQPLQREFAIVQA